MASLKSCYSSGTRTVPPTPMQVPAALIWTKQLPRKRIFVCRLAEAASKEGFSVETL